MVLTSLILLVTFTVYCYMPYMVGRGILSRRSPVRPPYGSQFREFVTAAVPGALFNIVAYNISKGLESRIGVMDWNVVAALFDLDTTPNAFKHWVSRGDLSGPVLYFVIVLSVAVVWAFIVILIMDATDPRRFEVSKDSSFLGAVVLTFGLLIVLPYHAFVHDRYIGSGLRYGRQAIARLESGSAVFGRIDSLDFDGEKLASILLGDVTVLTSIHDIESVRDTLIRKPFLSSHQMYLPVARIAHVVVLSRNKSVVLDLDAIAQLSGLPTSLAPKQTATATTLDVGA